MSVHRKFTSLHLRTSMYTVYRSHTHTHTTFSYLFRCSNYVCTTVRRTYISIHFCCFLFFIICCGFHSIFLRLKWTMAMHIAQCTHQFRFYFLRRLLLLLLLFPFSCSLYVHLLVSDRRHDFTYIELLYFNVSMFLCLLIYILLSFFFLLRSFYSSFSIQQHYRATYSKHTVCDGIRIRRNNTHTHTNSYSNVKTYTGLTIRLWKMNEAKTKKSELRT